MKKYLITKVDVSTGEHKIIEANANDINEIIKKHFGSWSNLDGEWKVVTFGNTKCNQQAGIVKDTNNLYSILIWI